MQILTEIARSSGKHFRYGDGFMIQCPAHDDKTPSCKIWEGPDGGVRFHCFAGCDWQACRDGAVKLGYLDAFRPKCIEGSIARQYRARQQLNAKHQRVAAELEQAKKATAAANQIWGGTVHAYETPTTVYLRKTRCISVEIPPQVIRHHPAMWHPDTLGSFPAMLCEVWNWDEGTLSGIHATYLKPDGTKADLSPGKIMRGCIKGAGVWLGKPAGMLNVCEGVETALSVFEMTGVATVAALSTSNMAALILPKTVTSVVIAADHDAPGLKAAQTAAVKFIQQGIKTRITVPPKQGDDWNDVLRQKAERSAA